MAKSNKDSKPGYKQTKIGLIPKDWDLCSFSEVADKKVKWSITGGPFGSNLKAEDYTPTGIRIIQLQNIGDGKFLNDYKIFTSKEKADELLSCNIYPGEIIISKMGDPVARACVIPNGDSRYLMASDGIRLVVDKENFDSTFVLSFINWNIFRSAAIKNGTGTTRQRIGLDELKNLPFVKPPLIEQQKLAHLLTTWDKAIEKTEQLIERKQQLKKGLMQQLLTGKVRFSGSNGNWKIKRIEELGTVIRGASPRPKSDPRYYGGNVPRLMVEDVTRDGKYVTPKVDFLTEEGAKLSRPCKAGTLTIVCSGDVGTPSFLAVDACIHDGFLGITNLSDQIDKDYLYYQVLRLKSKIERSATHGGVFTNLTTQILKDFEIKVPTLKEQKKISTMISQMDRDLLQEVKMLEMLQAQKRGLMHRLLTGEVRVKTN